MIKKILFFLILILLFSGFCCRAENTLNDMYNEQLEASGAEQLWESLPQSTRDLLDGIGINGLNADSFTQMQPQSISNSLIELVKQRASGPFGVAGVLMGVVLLYALMDGMRQTVREESVSKIFGTVCAIAACASLVIPVSHCIHTVSDAARSISVFMISFVPVYAGVMLASGQVVGAAGFQSIVLFASELISLAATHLIVPLMTVSMALGLTGAVTPEMKLDAAGGLINKCCGWFMALATTVFTGLLAIKELVGGAADTVTGRAVKFSLGTFVPIVGGALGEAYSSVSACLSLLKSTLGAFGVLATVVIVLPPLIECIMWVLCLSFCSMTAEIFSLDTVASLFKSAQGVLKTLIGVLMSCSMFMVVATTIVTLLGRNV